MDAKEQSQARNENGHTNSVDNNSGGEYFYDNIAFVDNNNVIAMENTLARTVQSCPDFVRFLKFVSDLRL